jgi:hypothetical protein
MTLRPDNVLVSTSPTGHTFTIGRLSTGEYVLDVLDNRSQEERLGPVIGDLASFYVEIDGAPQIVFAGLVPENDGPAQRVGLQFPDELVHRRVCDGVWMSFPRPFTPGMRVTATWHDRDGRTLREVRTPPLERRHLEPHPDAGWVGYARVET